MAAAVGASAPIRGWPGSAGRSGASVHVKRSMTIVAGAAGPRKVGAVCRAMDAASLSAASREGGAPVSVTHWPDTDAPAQP